jgi:hypothetical protein
LQDNIPKRDVVTLKYLFTIFPKKADSSITVDMPFSRNSAESGFLGNQFPPETFSGNERFISRKRQANDDPNVTFLWAIALFQQLQKDFDLPQNAPNFGPPSASVSF